MIRKCSCGGNMIQTGGYVRAGKSVTIYKCYNCNNINEYFVIMNDSLQDKNLETFII